ncbi:MAG: DUF2726 domain-containing protein [Planctomycetaceae bacterium]|jgi:hypothetical protein|nr:DUF2726 domain-containing protein [Planctomycetaceae bacterium]
MFYKKPLLTQNEIEFFYCLIRAFPEKHITVQTALSAIVETDEYKDRSQFRTYYADFVICDQKTFIPEMVIELDDKTHFYKKREEQDKRKNEVLYNANIPLYRYTAKANYTTAEIQKTIEPILTGKIQPPEYPQLERNRKVLSVPLKQNHLKSFTNQEVMRILLFGAAALIGIAILLLLSRIF